MYELEKKQLERKVGNGDVWALLKHYGCFIAGGAITSLFCNREINDIDVYFPSEEALFRCIASIYNEEEYTDFEVDRFVINITHVTQRSFMGSIKGSSDTLIQLLSFKYFSSPKEIFDSFDFTVCMGAYDCAKEEFVLHEDFLKHNSQRYLKFNTGTAFPIMSALRVDKYKEKGYSISKAEYLRVLFTCQKTPINSWEEAREHIGGMYGYDTKGTFDDTKEFSIDELIVQLGEVQNKVHGLYSPVQSSTDFMNIVKVLFGKYVKEDEVDRVVLDDSKYFYKCVNSDFKSTWSSWNNKICYNVGNVIELKDHIHGVYTHTSSNTPWQDTGYWVELEIVEPVEICRKDACSENKLLLRAIGDSGAVRVRRHLIDPLNTGMFSTHFRKLQKYIDEKYSIGEDK